MHSAVRQGTTVEFYLPKAKSSLAQDREPLKEDAVPLQASGTILFVEDDSLVRDAVVPALRNAGLNLITATNAKEALAMLESGLQVDTVISDVMMPGKIGGVELAAAILDRNDAIRIFLATGYSDYKIDLPNVKLLAKPYCISEIIGMLQ